MTGYHGFVQSIIKRGIDAYQITLGICHAESHERCDIPTDETGDQVLVYRADIAIEGDRTILFPDRELSKCMDAFYNPLPICVDSEVLEARKMVGRVAARICGEVGSLLLESVRTGSDLSADAGQLTTQN